MVFNHSLSLFGPCLAVPHAGRWNWIVRCVDIMQIALLRSNTPRLWAPGRSAVQMHIMYCIIYNIITCICELDDVFVFVMCLWTSVFCLKLHGRHCRKNILPVMFGCPLSMSDSPRPQKTRSKQPKGWFTQKSINHGRGWQRRQCCNWNWSWRSALEIQTKPIRRFVINLRMELFEALCICMYCPVQPG